MSLCDLYLFSQLDRLFSDFLYIFSPELRQNDKISDGSAKVSADQESREEPPSKKSKVETKVTQVSSGTLTEEQVLFISAVTDLITSKVNEFLAATTCPSRATKGNVTIIYDQIKDEYKANIVCPACSGVIGIKFAHRTSPCLYNYKRHYSSKHVNLVEVAAEARSETTTKARSTQPTIAEAFKNFGAKKACSSRLSNNEQIDLTDQSVSRDSNSIVEGK